MKRFVHEVTEIQCVAAGWNQVGRCTRRQSGEGGDAKEAAGIVHQSL